MAISEKFMCFGAIVFVNLLWSHGATISRPYQNDLYPASPSEVLQLKPLQIYPQPRYLKYFNSKEAHKNDDKVIYVKLLKVNYRPKLLNALEQADVPPKDATAKDIFYVKALANGQFSDRRLKVYRLPEFFAINVYKKNEV